MNKQAIKTLLDALDSSVNSNSFWIELDMPSDETNIEKVLLRHLELGNFHHEVSKQDIERGWNLYSELIFPKNSENPSITMRPGNIWNGNRTLEASEIQKEDLYVLLNDLLTGAGKQFTPSSSGQLLLEKTAKLLIKELLISIDRSSPTWKAYRLAPTFLNIVNDKFEECFGKPAYFENNGRDFALCIQVGNSIQILLVNGFN